MVAFKEDEIKMLVSTYEHIVNRLEMDMKNFKSSGAKKLLDWDLYETQIDRYYDQINELESKIEELKSNLK